MSQCPQWREEQEIEMWERQNNSYNKQNTVNESAIRKEMIEKITNHLQTKITQYRKEMYAETSLNETYVLSRIVLALIETKAEFTNWGY